MNTQVEIIEIKTLKDFAQLVTDWNAVLENHSYPQFQFRFEWLYTWTKHLGREGDFVILVFRENGKTIGAIPLMYERRKVAKTLPVSVLTFLSNGSCDNSDFFISQNNEKVIAAFFEYLSDNKSRWHELVLLNIPQKSKNLPLIEQALKASGFDFSISAPKEFFYVNTANGTWEQYRKTTSKKFVRKDLNRINNRFAEAGGYDLVRVSRDNPELSLQEAYRQISRMHRARQEMIGRNSKYENRRYEAFTKEVLETFFNLGMLEITFLQFQNKLIAYYVAFLEGNCCYLWNTAFDVEYSEFSPSKLLMSKVIESCFERKIAKVSFMRGQADYKTKWTKTHDFAFDLRVRNNLGTYSNALHKLKALKKGNNDDA